MDDGPGAQHAGTGAPGGSSGADATLPVSQAPEVSFVVIAYNEEVRIEATVSSLAAQDDLGAFEIVVVDDGSTDQTSAVVTSLAQRLPALRLVRHDVNLGRGAARATGIEAARGHYVALADADVVFPAHWWATCRAHLSEHDAVGGTAVPDGDVAYVHERAKLKPRVRRATSTVPGSNGAFRAEVLREVTFDRSLAEGEDVAINHALRAHGYRLFSIPGLTVEHREGKRFGAAARWLFVSGVGATRQLVRYRQLRTPDLALVGWWASLGFAFRARRRPLVALAALVGFPVAAATAHVAQRFELSPRTALRGSFAVVLDATLLVAYFLGRTWGVPVLVVRRCSSAGRS